MFKNVKLKSDFEDQLKEQEQALEKKEEKQLLELERPSIQPLFKGFIHPNPVNLSQKLLKLMAKEIV